MILLHIHFVVWFDWSNLLSFIIFNKLVIIISYKLHNSDPKYFNQHSTLVPEVFCDISHLLIFLLMRELQETCKPVARKENLWLLRTWISLSCRCQGQGLTLRLGLVDIFTNIQINMIGLFDWQYGGDDGDICYCTFWGKFHLNLYKGKSLFAKYFSSQFIRIQDSPVFDMDYVSVSVVDGILTLVLEEHFPEIENLTKHPSLSRSHKSEGCNCHTANQTLIRDVGKYLYLSGYSYPHHVMILVVSSEVSGRCKTMALQQPILNLSNEQWRRWRAQSSQKRLYAFLFGSLEAFLQNEKGRNILHSKV